MDTAIISVIRFGEQQERDLEVPTGIPVADLKREICLALGWDANLEVYAAPPERVLSPVETLAQAGVRDGAFLVFHPQGTRPSYSLTISIGPFTESSTTPAPPTYSPPAEGPVKGWRSLDGIPIPQSPEPPPPAKSGGFEWKRIDQD